MTEPVDCDPFSLALEEFLAGPDGTRDLDIDPIFATPLDQLLGQNPSNDLAWDKHSLQWPCTILPGLRYVEVDAGVLLVDDQNRIAGCYVWASLAIAEKWQGQGLGRDIVIQRITREEANPVWNLDTPAYSPGGRAAHESAWRQMHRRPAAA